MTTWSVATTLTSCGFGRPSDQDCQTYWVPGGPASGSGASTGWSVPTFQMNAAGTGTSARSMLIVPPMLAGFFRMTYMDAPESVANHGSSSPSRLSRNATPTFAPYAPATEGGG